MRRVSEPLQAKVKSKVITAANVTPVPAASLYSPTMGELIDDVAYKRNMESILEEIKRSQPRNYIINQLLKLTFGVRRQKVNCSVSHTLDLLEEFPFFKQKKWVYT